MHEVTLNKSIEERIESEIIVDAYGHDEVAIGWYYYINDKLRFPFKATCTAEDELSPLHIGEVVKVLEMASSYACNQTLLVKIRLLERTFTVPLSQLEGLGLSEEENEAIHDWHYWTARGYEFS